MRSRGLGPLLPLVPLLLLAMRPSLLAAASCSSGHAARWRLALLPLPSGIISLPSQAHHRVGGWCRQRRRLGHHHRQQQHQQRALATASSSSSSSSSSGPPSAESRHARRPLKFFHNDVWHVDMPPGHRFPMAKYLQFRQQAQRRLEGTGLASFVPSPLAQLADLATTHDKYYIQRYLTGRMTPEENRAIGFPWNRQHVERTLSSVGGTVEAMHSLFRPLPGEAPPTAAADDDDLLPRCGAHLAGGTHHAFHGRGEGFCIFSDIAVAANVCLRDHGDRVRRILIVDLDVHQGNGNAVLFQGEGRVFTFSMHCSGNYFSQRQASDLDVEVAPGTGDEGYLRLLEEHLPAVFEAQAPDLVFYQAGVDVIASDRLGRLKLSREGARRRNRMVYELVDRHKARLVVTAGGGYPVDSDPASQAFHDIIDAHADVYVQAAEFFGGGPGNFAGTGRL